MGESRGTLRSLAVSLLATIGLFAAVELSVRLAGIQPPPWPTPGSRMDLRLIRADPLLGGLPTPGWKGRWFGSFRVEIDERGFRRDGFVAPESPAATVAFVGDSCTFGWGVDDAQTFVGQVDALQRQGAPPRLRLYNAGFQGQSAVVGIYMLREKVLPMKPQVVVIGYSANNAFRLSVRSDAARFRFFAVRKLMLRSRVFQILAAKMARNAERVSNPRDRALVEAAPWSGRARVAAADEFEAAVRQMVRDARRQGSEPLLLVLPRASNVSREQRHEDAGFAARFFTGESPRPGGRLAPEELNLFEMSCLDHRHLDDPGKVLREKRETWQPVFPDEDETERLLRSAARSFVGGDHAAARQGFEEALRRSPTSPLAHYDLGVTLLATGDRGGLDLLAAADRLACSVFLHYQTILWSVAVAESVPIVDASIHFQARGGALFLDPAHPNPEGHRIVGAALWPVLDAMTSANGPSTARR
jgi:lysophospholipase L1-like esterase